MKLPVAWPAPGHYILAVSGGADSMVLLDLMAGAAQERGYHLTVAHFDHGLRHGSQDDRLLVQGASKRYDLPFRHHDANLGQGSEATARAARHSWLEQVRAQCEAAAVITAHHQDDLIETSLLNLARGSGRRGLAPMAAGPILRPLIGLTREQLRTYAGEHHVVWHEDPTNADTTNPRNFLRHSLLPAAPPGWRRHYLENIQKLAALNTKLDQSFASLLGAHAAGDSGYSFPRALVLQLSLPELEELIHLAALRLRPGVELDRRVLQEMALFAKTAAPHRRRPLRRGLEVATDRDGISVLAV